MICNVDNFGVEMSAVIFTRVAVVKKEHGSKAKQKRLGPKRRHAAQEYQHDI